MDKDDKQSSGNRPQVKAQVKDPDLANAGLPPMSNGNPSPPGVPSTEEPEEQDVISMTNQPRPASVREPADVWEDDDEWFDRVDTPSAPRSTESALKLQKVAPREIVPDFAPPPVSSTSVSATSVSSIIDADEPDGSHEPQHPYTNHQPGQDFFAAAEPQPQSPPPSLKAIVRTINEFSGSEQRELTEQPAAHTLEADIFPEQSTAGEQVIVEASQLEVLQTQDLVVAQVEEPVSGSVMRENSDTAGFAERWQGESSESSIPPAVEEGPGADVQEQNPAGSDNEPTLAEELRITDLLYPIAGGRGRLFSTAGPTAPVVEFKDDFVVMHPPDKPFREEGPTEDIVIRTDNRGVLLDELGKPKRISGATYRGASLWFAGEQKPGTLKHWAVWFDQHGAMHRLYVNNEPLTTDIIFRLRIKTHDGELSAFPDIQSD